MSILRRVLGPAEGRANLNDPNVPLSPAAVQALFTMPNTDAGVPVTEASALRISTVWRCVNLLANTAAGLPLRAYKVGTFEPVPSPLLDNPHPEMTAFELWRLTFVHRLLWGNAFLEKIRDGAYRIRWLNPIHPKLVTGIKWSKETGKKEFTIRQDDGVTRTLSSDEVLHLPGIGYDGLWGMSPIEAAAQSMGLSLAAEKFGAKLFGNGTMLSGVLATDERLKAGEADSLKQRWKAKMTGPDAAHDVAILDNGAKFIPMSMPNTAAQFIESRGFQVQEIARMFGVPPHLVGDVVRSTSWGTGIEQQAIGFVTFTVQPDWLIPTEQRITKELLFDPTVYARYEVEGLLRGDAASRAEFYRTMRELGVYSVNEIRAEEKRPDVADGDSRIQPLNMAPMGSPPSEGGVSP